MNNYDIQIEMQKFWTGDGWHPNAVSPLQCNHCYCLDTQAPTARPAPHRRCCKCGDERAVAGRIMF